MDSYIRRKRWENRDLAVSVVNVYAEAMSGKKRGKNNSNTEKSSVTARDGRNYGAPPLGALAKIGMM